MSHFLVINPNTSIDTTAAMDYSIRLVCHDDDTFDVIHSEIGSASLESFKEYDLASAAVYYTLKKIDISRYDGVLLACFGDPGLYGLKESIPCPVVGIAEASLSMALLLGYKAAILVALEKAVPMMNNMVQQYGLSRRLAGVFGLGMNVLDIVKNPKVTKAKMVEIGKRAIAEGAEVLILGCAGMTGFSTDLESELNVTVIDPIITGFNVLKSIVDSKLKVSRSGLYKPSLQGKDVNGMELFF